MMDFKRLEKEQQEFAKKIILKDDFGQIDYFAGVDQSIYGEDIFSCIVVMDKDMNVVEKVVAKKKANFPYVPGFLAYREGPAIIDAFSELKQRPDLMLVDGNGVLHPRRFGLACYVGLALDIPTIGVAKSLLVGEEKGGSIIVEGKVLGKKIEPKKHAKPIYVSQGHKVSLDTAQEITKRLIIKPHKLPEPLHLAHKFAKENGKE